MYIPENAVSYVDELLDYSRVQLKIVRGRSTKYGDYKLPVKGAPSVITINRDLNSFAFLITLVHEVAHALAYIKYGRKIKPHGVEWKNTFRELMQPLLTLSIFPEELLQELNRHMQNPKASTGSDTSLFRILRSFDKHEKLYLEDLDYGDRFSLRSGRVFKKGDKRRKNFLCISEDNRRKYLVNPLAEVTLVQKALRL